MSTIKPYEKLPLETPSEQTTVNQASWRGWSWKPLKPQQEFLIGLNKLMGVQAIGFFIATILSGISSQVDIAGNSTWRLTDTYYKTCQQAQSAFGAITISTGIYLLCAYGYFLKKNQEKCDETISPDMQVAIQHQIEEEMQTQLGKI